MTPTVAGQQAHRSEKATCRMYMRRSGRQMSAKDFPAMLASPYNAAHVNMEQQRIASAG